MIAELRSSAVWTIGWTVIKSVRLDHYHRMRGFVTVQTPEEFQKWLDDKVKEQSAPDPFK